jgi:hypothetical protein
MKSKLFYILLFVIVCSGCSQYFRWNPVLNGLEFEDELLFNTKEIGIHLKGFYVINVFRIGKIEFEFKNLSQDTIRISRQSFLLTLAKDTMHAREWGDESLTIPPSKLGDFTVSFEYSLYDKSLFNGTHYYLPSNLEVTLLPVNILVGSKQISFPSIGFRPKQRGEENKKVEFAN